MMERWMNHSDDSSTFPRLNNKARGPGPTTYLSIEETIKLWKVIKHMMLYVMDFRPAPSDGVVVKFQRMRSPMLIFAAM
jgi:hypothetical protein